ncbi:argininosuccinate lyase [Noviherbaspirillum pedocola]|uniref:argininosuccinate lyase n=1 Tax=Noviherbaspirillum pedocola TaxID=2801341 RepID=A0A934W9I6_9BURK|nr:argininosuccinate lyase [Noviherbaspirillum pedocola]MBK4738955.1 argininosuccinate lyase [Noviherbaspirillum pedocola]
MTRAVSRAGLCGLLLLASSAQAADVGAAKTGANHDAFYWLGEINKASTVINADEGLLDRALAPRIASGISKVLADGNQPGGKRPSLVITFEPLLIAVAGEEATLIHAGRSSQDMLSTVRAAMLREALLNLAAQLDKTSSAVVMQARRQRDTIVPNYTNGVAAQPNSYGHYLLGIAAGLDRDAERIREAYARLDRSPMGTTVLNGSSWPLDRKRMAGYLGFGAIVDNAYDAAQISAVDAPVEAASIVTSIALHAGGFIEDVMTQYAQPRPWILLQEGGGNTYVSSAMPQKRNPGLLNLTREHASDALTLAMGPAIRAHNLPPGMHDAKDEKTNGQMVAAAIDVLQRWERIMSALVIDPQRALDELDSDWTASQELADELMRNNGIPFRVGHHFASKIVDYAKAHDIRPSAFPYGEAKRIYAESREGFGPAELPMTEAQFRAALDPVAIVKHRATVGGPQPAEMERMLKAADARLAQQRAWIAERRGAIDAALARLDHDFDRLLPR